MQTGKTNTETLHIRLSFTYLITFSLITSFTHAKLKVQFLLFAQGFGRSSRPAFTQDAVIAEKQLVKSIEEWRQEMNIQEMILLGHSMGGFLATSYTISYPDRVKHLILADPWGFQDKPKEIKAPLWIRAIGKLVAPMNPLWALRAAGPYGQWVVEKTRPDIIRKFTEVIDGDEENVNVVAQYIHQCNAQSPR